MGNTECPKQFLGFGEYDEQFLRATRSPKPHAEKPRAAIAPLYSKFASKLLVIYDAVDFPSHQ